MKNTQIDQSIGLQAVTTSKKTYESPRFMNLDIAGGSHGKPAPSAAEDTFVGPAS